MQALSKKQQQKQQHKKPHRTQKHKTTKQETTERTWHNSSNRLQHKLPANSKILRMKQRGNTKPQSKILRRCPAKHTTQQRRNPGSPLQDPGDRAEKPSGMRHLRNRRRPCNELQSWKMGLMIRRTWMVRWEWGWKIRMMTLYQPEIFSRGNRGLGWEPEGDRIWTFQKQTTHQATKRKLSSAKPNCDKNNYCQRQHKIASWNPTLIYFRMRRASCCEQVPHCQKWNCRSTAFCLGHFKAVFDFCFTAGKTKIERAKTMR